MMKLLVLILIYIKENVCILYKEKYQNYRVMNYYKDVTILLNGLEYHQHKVFMANSLFFDKLFKSNPTNSYFELYLPITTEMFKIIIKILYSVEVMKMNSINYQIHKCLNYIMLVII